MGHLRYLNLLIGGVLCFAGIVVIRWPSLIDPTINAPTTAATLAGALFGAAALFVGAQINEVVRQRDAQAQTQDRQSRVRAIIENEFVRVCVNHMQYADDLSKSLNYPGQPLDFGEPPPNPIFEDARLEILCLPQEEIDALCTFYGGLDATRRAIRDESRAFNIRGILGNVHHDLETAAEVARKVWPNRKIQFARGEFGLADKLNEQAVAVAKALKEF